MPNEGRDTIARLGYFIRCDADDETNPGCGCSFRPPEEGRPICPLCGRTPTDAAWFPEEKDEGTL